MTKLDGFKLTVCAEVGALLGLVRSYSFFLSVEIIVVFLNSNFSECVAKGLSSNFSYIIMLFSLQSKYCIDSIHKFSILNKNSNIIFSPLIEMLILCKQVYAHYRTRKTQYMSRFHTTKLKLLKHAVTKSVHYIYKHI